MKQEGCDFCRSHLRNTELITTVLGLVEVELVFFIVACMVLCFRLEIKTALITHQGFSHCWILSAQC